MVNLANGNLHTVIPIAAWPGVQFNLYHNSLGSHELASLGGRGWLHSYSAHLDIDGNDVVYVADDGREVPFTLSSGEDENEVYRMTLEFVDDSPDFYRLIDAAQNNMRFDVNGVLLWIADASGNKVNLTYDGGILDKVEDEVGRTIKFHYNGDDQVDRITFPPIANNPWADSDDMERVCELDYAGMSNKLDKIYSMRRDRCCRDSSSLLFWIQTDYDGSSRRLTSLTDYGDEGSDGTNDHHTWNFDYYNSGGGHRFQEVTNPLVYDFDADDDVATVRAYAYGTPAGGEVTTTVTDERENDWVYTFDSPAGRLLSLEDPLIRMLAQLTWTDLNRPASITNVLGGETTFDYTFNMDGSETIEVLGPQNEDPVIIDIDELNRLTQITDPLEQVTAFAYDDTDNSTRMTEMDGPGDQNTALFCWTSSSELLAGLPRAIASPSNTTQGFHYDFDSEVTENMPDPVGNLYHWEHPANVDAKACPNIPDHSQELNTALTGGCQDGRSYISNPGGESFASGEAADCTPGGSLPGSCETPDASCGVCGCAQHRDHQGNVIQSCGGSGCCYGPPSSLGEVDSPWSCAENGCYTWLASAPIKYDANDRLVEVEADTVGADRNGIGYELEYDARGRMTSYVVLAPDHTDTEPPGREGMLINYNGILHFHIAPAYENTFEFSDTTGAYRETYTRTNDPDDGDPATRTMTTTYQTDDAGRITSITRDGEETTIAYSDNGSPSVANITITHADGSESLYYLNDAGELCKIVHRTEIDSTPTVVASFEVLARDDNRRITQIEGNFLDPGAADDYRTERVTFTYGDGHIVAGERDSGAWTEFDKVYWSFLSGIALDTSDPNRLVQEVRTLWMRATRETTRSPTTRSTATTPTATAWP